MAATADPTETAPATPAKKSKKPLIIGLILALSGGGGGFVAVQMGLLGGATDHAEDSDESLVDLPEIAPVAYVALDPLVVNLPRDSGRQFLSFRAQLEIPPEHAAEVEGLKPRIMDVMNSYLRAVEPADFEGSDVLVLLRAQLLRRIQVIAGEGRVRDLLVQEFILN